MARLSKFVVAAVLSAGVVASLPTSASAGNGEFFAGMALGAMSGAAMAGARPVSPYPQSYGGGGTHVIHNYNDNYVTQNRYCWMESRPVVNQFNMVVGSTTVRKCRYN